MLMEWLGVTCCFFEPADTEAVRVYAQTLFFPLIVVYLEGLVTLWTQTPPDRDRFHCLQTVVDLLEIVASKKDRTRDEIQDELIASFLLCAALWNQARNLPLLGGVAQQDHAKGDLRSLLGDNNQLAEIVRIVRKQHGLVSFR